MALFEAYNEAGSLQFNAQTFAYTFVEKGTVTLANRFTINEDGSDGIYLTTEGFKTIAGGWDIIVFNSPNVAIIPRADTYSGLPANSFVIVADALLDGDGNYLPSTFSTTCNYWVFKSSRTYLSPSASGVGLELYNADGTVCYSSTQRPLLVRSSAAIASFNSSWTASVNLPVGPVYAHMLYGTVKSGPFLPALKTRANGWDGKAAIRQSGTLTNVVDGGFLTVDVTGY
jgi:hypothetical protein